MNGELERFRWAQSDVIDRVLEELAAGRKSSHWMWFVFPQVAGLGRSVTAQHYAIGSEAEAQAYLDDPVLGARLRECCQLLLSHEGVKAEAILGAVDALKLRSSMTLFHAVSGEVLFQRVLDVFYNAEGDPATLDTLARWRA